LGFFAAEGSIDQMRVDETERPEETQMNTDVAIETDDAEIIDLNDRGLLLDSSSDSDSLVEDTEEVVSAETKSLASTKTPVGKSGSGQTSPDTTIITNPISFNYDLDSPV